MRLPVHEHDRVLCFHISENPVCENTDELEITKNLFAIARLGDYFTFSIKTE